MLKALQNKRSAPHPPSLPLPMGEGGATENQGFQAPLPMGEGLG